jgi:hypothetical protein
MLTHPSLELTLRYALTYGLNALGKLWDILKEVRGQNLVEEFMTKEYKYAVSTILGKALKG